MKLGVFDSGIGGEAIASALQKSYPSAEITTINDRAHLPYGDKTADEIKQLTNAAIQPLLGSDVIVIACNSATTAAIDWLREQYSEQKFIGIEPMIKPATNLTKTYVIAVCATKATLASDRYKSLLRKHASHLTIIEPDCSMWAQYIEENTITRQHIQEVVEECRAKDADVIVLGCTHYHWIKQEIADLAGENISILEPSETISLQIGQLLSAQRASE